MEVRTCQAIKQDLELCGKAGRPVEGYDKTLCSRHKTLRETNGPHCFRRDQAKLAQTKIKSTFERLFTERLQAAHEAEANELEIDELRDRQLEIRERHRIYCLQENRRISRLENEEIRALGYDPDRQAKNRRIIKYLVQDANKIIRDLRTYGNEYVRHNVERIIIKRIGFIENINTFERDGHVEDARKLREELETFNHNILTLPLEVRDNIDIMIAQYERRRAEEQERRLRMHQQQLERRQQQAEARELERFANDKQNVHTKHTVNQVKRNIAIINSIPVPNEYKWSMNNTSKTFKEIVYECDLSPKANAQFANFYCSDKDIYEMGSGVFGKVTDGVWQYIINSEDRKSLISILKTELEDNIDMCAQGNLSRIANVLAGYLDGIGVEESQLQKLGRLFSEIINLDITDTEKLERGRMILIENNVPENEFNVWLDPLVVQ